MCIATGAFTVSSDGVLPARRSRALWPETRPPAGAARAAVIPLARATGNSSLWGLTAIHASAWGLTSPVSVVSTEPGTLPISTRPSVVRPSMRPG